MQLLTLTLDNFQGIKTAKYNFDGKNANIYGDNATGKTTIFNAYTWLLFDKPSTGAKGFSPKTKGPKGDLHNLEHAAEAQFRADDGRIITLRKVFAEVYKKKRGSSTKEFDGHTTEFYIDGVPAKEKEYQDYLDTNFGPADRLKMLTMPMYFAEEMDWQSRRQILLDICGDITDDDVIASTADLKDLRDYLLLNGTTDQWYAVDDYRRLAGAQKSQINKQLQEIPNRIDEAQRAIPDLTGVTAEAVNAALIDLHAAKVKAEADKSAVLDKDTATAELRRQIADLQAQMAVARTEHIKGEIAKNEAANREIAEIKTKIAAANQDLSELENALKYAKRDLSDMVGLREKTLAEYSQQQKIQWHEDDAVCPACKRRLPEGDIEKLIADFNLRKSEALAEINERGQKECSKNMIADLKEKATGIQDALDRKEKEIADLQKSLDAAKRNLREEMPFDTTEAGQCFIEEMASLRDQESDIASVQHEKLTKYRDKIDALSWQIKEQEEIAAQLKLAEIQRQRITELESQEKSLASEFENVERGLYLCDLFIKTKVSMLTGRINAKFKSVSFRLFLDQINGGVKEDCEVLVPGASGRMVPYRDANNAARINAGLEIIKVLSEHWGLSMPVFVDNAESVTKLTDMGGQIVRLVVSENDKKLRLEIE